MSNLYETGLIEKQLDVLVQQQFPSFYQTDGPTFVAFLMAYYNWLQGISEAATPASKGTVFFKSRSQTVIGTNTFFLDEFAPEDRIALYYDDTTENYQVFTVQEVVSDTELILTPEKTPSYSSDAALYGTVALVKMPNYHIRRFSDYDDIDTVPDEFIIYFKEQYLKDIQFTTKTNTRQLIKHSLDLYRSKGTPRGLDLLFRLVFGVGANIYLPSDDLFKLSDGNWYVPHYLELSLNDETVKFVNHQIRGQTSGATAFVESAIRRTVNGKHIDVIYISAIKGDFQTSELINTDDKIIDNDQAPVIIGSLTTIEVDAFGVSSDYQIGDTVDVSSPNGNEAKARVTSIANNPGVVDFNFLNGGYGYTANTEVIVSDKVLVVNNVTSNSALNEYFFFEEVISQPLANIHYVSANGSFAVGANVNFYFANGDQSGFGKVLSVSPSNSTAGDIFVSKISGNVISGYVTTDSNTIGANISGQNDLTALGTVVGTADKIILRISNNNVFKAGDVVTQNDPITNATIAYGTIKTTQNDGLSAVLTLENTHGAFAPNNTIFSTKGGQSTITNIQVNIGVLVTNNDFRPDDGNFITAANSQTGGVITLISQGAGASANVYTNNFLYEETIQLNSDYIHDYLNVVVSSNSYGLPANTSAGFDSEIYSSLTFEPVTIGKLERITDVNKGIGYSIAPITKVIDKTLISYQKKNVILSINNITGVFQTGELITQDGVDSRGLVSFANSTTVYAELLRFDDSKFFVPTSGNTSLSLIGDQSGVSADIVSISIDESSEVMGLNAVLDTATANAQGAITGLQVLGSGFNFFENEPVILSSNGHDLATGVAHLGKSGKALGYYKEIGGFLSDQKKLFDGLYYQEFSYEVRSSITLNRYETMLRKIMHVAGTKYFGALYHETHGGSNINHKTTIITQS